MTTAAEAVARAEAAEAREAALREALRGACALLWEQDVHDHTDDLGSHDPAPCRPCLAADADGKPYTRWEPSSPSPLPDTGGARAPSPDARPVLDTLYDLHRYLARAKVEGRATVTQLSELERVRAALDGIDALRRALAASRPPPRAPESAREEVPFFLYGEDPVYAPPTVVDGWRERAAEILRDVEDDLCTRAVTKARALMDEVRSRPAPTGDTPTDSNPQHNHEE